MAVYDSHCHGFALFNVTQKRQKRTEAFDKLIFNESSCVVITTFGE